MVQRTRCSEPGNFARQVKNLPMYSRVSKYWTSIIRHTTLRKALNALTAEFEFTLGRTHLRSRPYIYFIDPINLCNLRCPLCPTGMGIIKRHQQLMEWETFTNIIDKIAPYAFQVRLYNWGEPTLHPKIYNMIRYAKSKNIGVVMSSNLVKLDQKDIRELVDSGLEYLTISIDGTSQEIYSRYRVRGNFGEVLDHLKAILEYRRSKGSRTPLIEWQYVVMKHNEFQMGEARRLAEETGVDVLRFIPVGLPFDANIEERQELAEQWMPNNPVYRKLELKPKQDYLFNERCFYLYRSMTINPEGKAAPCCIVYDERYDFGDFTTVPLSLLWNNISYRSARNLYTSRKDMNARTGTVCHKCLIYRKTPQSRKERTREEYLKA